MKKWLIVTGGNVDIAFASDFLKKQRWDGVIAADHGLEACLQLGVDVDYLIGDFDSIRQDVLEKTKKMQMQVLKYPSEKDETDTELAIYTAIEHGAQDIQILGATGTRLDHTLANIHLLKQVYKKGIQASIIDAYNRIRLILPGTTVFYKDEMFGKYISFLPLEGDIYHAVLRGFHYSGDDIHFLAGTSLGVSNEVVAEKAELTIDEGRLIMIESRDEIEEKVEKMPVILASGSPRRKELLEQAGFTFEVIPSHVEEKIMATDPEKVVQSLALQKALDIAIKHPNSLVIGADTIVVCDKKILGKPSSKEMAYQMLSSLQNRKHSVYTGVAFVWTEENISKQVTFVQETVVSIAALSDTEIWAYIMGGSPMDKAGAYGIQDDFGLKYITQIEGDYYNVVGLPVARLYQELKKQGLLERITWNAAN
jgi:MAF protein/thiamine pyrophosphokinase